jgi:hypothetical protein
VRFEYIDLSTLLGIVVFTFTLGGLVFAWYPGSHIGITLTLLGALLMTIVYDSMLGDNCKLIRRKHNARFNQSK